MRKRFPTPPELLTSMDVSHAVMAAWLNGAPASDAPYLRPEHFPADRDKAAWAAILELEAEGVAADYTVLVERLKRSALVSDTDWPSYCTHILSAAQLSSSLNLEKHAHIVYENYRRLQMVREANRMATRALDLTLPLPEEETSEPPAKKRWSVADIRNAEIPEAGGPWPGVIPPGLTVIGARPKYGKSILMLQASAAIASGGMLFGKQMEQKPVLYYALEDSLRRLKERLDRLDVPLSAKLDFARDVKPLHLGGLAEIEAATHDYGMIVVDTISRAVPGQDFTRDAALFGDLLARLQKAALEANMSIVVVVHTRKPNGMDHDPVDDVLGSTQMTAAADCVLAIFRDGQGRSTLKGRSRDMEDVDLTLQFDPTTVCWQLVGETSDVERTECEDEILEVLVAGRASAPVVARAVGKDLRNTRRRLMRLVERGQCEREIVGNEVYYFLEERAALHDPEAGDELQQELLPAVEEV